MYPIKINHLRVNCNVLRKGKITKINCNHILACSSGADYLPIEITPEILINCGFEETLNYKWRDGSITPLLYKKGQYFIEFTNNDTIIVLVRFCSGGSSYINNIKYLHELQNGWLFLTNEELILL